MSFRLWRTLQGIWEDDRYERTKLALLALSFFFIIGSYTVVRTLKDTFFTSIVGREYLPQAKLLSIIVLIPGVLLFSKLTDLLRRTQIMYFYCLLYGIGGLILAYMIGNPTMGLLNANLSGDRWLGWFLYFFIEGYNPFVVSLFWSFCHTVTTPEGAKRQYPLIVAASKTGGIITSWFSCVALDRCASGLLSDQVVVHQWMLLVSSLMLLTVPLIVWLLMRIVPKSHLHGYEAAYLVERERAQSEQKAKKSPGFFETIDSMFSGFYALLRYPYMFGIFGMIFFWEVINVFVNFERLSAAEQAGLSLAGKTSYLLYMDCLVHVVGLVITLLGTRAVLELLGERKALILIPILTGPLLAFYLSAQHSIYVMGIVYVVIRAINYAFAYPLRESLYIPTTRDLKFKTKSWIDSFGTKVAKGCGSSYSWFQSTITAAQLPLVHCVFWGSLLSLWLFVAHFLGRRYERAIERNEVIGAD